MEQQCGHCFQIQHPKSLVATKLLHEGEAMITILLVILILLLIGALPALPL
jgi:hypothetical protein